MDSACFPPYFLYQTVLFVLLADRLTLQGSPVGPPCRWFGIVLSINVSWLLRVTRSNQHYQRTAVNNKNCCDHPRMRTRNRSENVIEPCCGSIEGTRKRVARTRSRCFNVETEAR